MMQYGCKKQQHAELTPPLSRNNNKYTEVKNSLMTWESTSLPSAVVPSLQQTHTSRHSCFHLHLLRVCVCVCVWVCVSERMFVVCNSTIHHSCRHLSFMPEGSVLRPPAPARMFVHTCSQSPGRSHRPGSPAPESPDRTPLRWPPLICRDWHLLWLRLLSPVSTNGSETPTALQPLQRIARRLQREDGGRASPSAPRPRPRLCPDLRPPTSEDATSVRVAHRSPTLIFNLSFFFSPLPVLMPQSNEW